MSDIDWTDKTWDPVEGCAPVSKGCDHCWAAKLVSTRFAHLPLYQGLATGGVFNDIVRTVPYRLDEPLAARKPGLWFVCSRADLFHPQVPTDYIARMFAIMALTAGRHTFQILTKRPARARTLLNRNTFLRAVAVHATDIIGRTHIRGRLDLGGESLAGDSGRRGVGWEVLDGQWTPQWPLPNVWLGTSVEDQETADDRIHHLVNTCAAVRWVSYEPALGPVDFFKWVAPECHCTDAELDNGLRAWSCPTHGTAGPQRVDWIVVGGESGNRDQARPMHPDWARAVRDLAVEHGVDFFYKQEGSWVATARTGPLRPPHIWVHPDGRIVTAEQENIGDVAMDGTWTGMWHVGGHGDKTLNGEVWHQFPDFLMKEAIHA